MSRVPNTKNSTDFSGRSSGRFRAVSTLTRDRVRRIAEQRGITISRLLTEWADVVGKDIGAMSRPVQVSWARSPTMGGTLVLEVPGSRAQELSMKVELIIERVNRAYGYNAIGRVRLIHTTHAELAKNQTGSSTELVAILEDASQQSWDTVQSIENKELREALFDLGTYVFSRGDEEEKEE